MPNDLFTTAEFARGLRLKHPALASESDDDRLVGAFLQAYPDFRKNVLTSRDMGGMDLPTGRPDIPIPSATAPPKPLDPEAYRDPDTYYARQGWNEFVQEGPGRVARGVVGVGKQIAAGARIAGSEGLPAAQQAEILQKNSPPTIDEALKPYADVVGGTFKTAEPTILPAIALAPEVTIPSIVVSTALSEGVKYLTEQLGAPPSATELLSAAAMVAGTGVTAGKIHGVMKERAAFRDSVKQAFASARPEVQRRLWAEARQNDAAAQARGAVQLKQAAAQEALTQTRQVAQQTMAGTFNYLDEAIDATKATTAISEGLQQGYASQAAELPPPHVSGLPAVVGPPEVYDTSRMIGRAGGQPVYPETIGIDQFPSGPVNMDTGEIYQGPPTAVAPPYANIETPRGRVVAQSPIENAPEPLVTKLGDQLERAQGEPPSSTAPRLSPATETRIRGKLREQDAYKAALKSVVEDAAGEMADNTHQRGKWVDEGEGKPSYYVPPKAGADVYWQIVNLSDVSTKPARRYVQSLLEALRDTGAKTAKELPSLTDKDPQRAAIMRDLMEGLGLKTEKGAREAYAEWLPRVNKALDRLARRRMDITKRLASNELTPMEREAWLDEAPPAATATEAPGTTAAPLEGPPATTAVAQGIDDLPEFLRTMETPEQVEGGWEPGEAGAPESVPAGPPEARVEASPEVLGGEPATAANTQAVPSALRESAVGENNAGTDTGSRPVFGQPAATGPKQGDLYPGYDPQKGSFFDQFLKGEEGTVVLNVRPGNVRGLREWFKRHEGELGDEGWFQQARGLLEQDNANGAYRAALTGVARLNAEAGVKAAAGTSERERQRAATSTVGMSPKAQETLLSTVEDHIGQPLPKGTTVGAGGVLKMPGNPGGLDPKFSDLPLARSLTEELMAATDPTQVVRVEDESGHLDEAFVAAHPEMRITAQMADQIVRSMPDEVVGSFTDLLGLDRAQLGQHFQRAFSQAGKLLHAAKVWQDEHWDDILHLDPLTGSSRGPGAAGRLEFLPPERASLIRDYLEGRREELTSDEMDGVLNDIQKLSPKQLKEIGFRLPEGAKVEGKVPADTKPARTYVSHWLRQQRQMVELGRRIDAIAESEGIDRAKIAAALGEPAKGGARDTAYALMRARLSFLISQMSTALHVFGTQQADYLGGTLEEIGKGVLYSMKGDVDAAKQSWTLAKNFNKGWTARNSVPMGLVKNPTMDGVQVAYEMSGLALETADPRDVRMALKQLGDYPDLEKELMGTLMAHEPRAGEKLHVPKNRVAKFLTSPKLGNVLTVAMRVQEATTRSVIYDAMLRTAIEMKGDDPVKVLRSEGGLTEKYGETEARAMHGAAIARALYGTQASKPYEGTMPAWFLEHLGNWDKYPHIAGAASFVVPYPKFAFGGGPRWLWDRLPGAIAADIFRMKVPLPLGTPRLELGLQLQDAQVALPKLHLALGEAQFRSAEAFGAHVQEMYNAQALLKEHRAAERELAKSKPGQGELYGATKAKYDNLVGLTQQVESAVRRAAEAKEAHAAAERQVQAQQRIIKETEKKISGLQEIAAPNWETMMTRQAIGGLMLAGAIGMRFAQPDDTKWNEVEIPKHVPVLGGTRVDMRWTGPYAAWMLMGDVVKDVYKNSHRDEMARYLDEHPDQRIDHRWIGAMRAGYQGKYTAGPLLRDATEAFISLNGALGGTSAALDAITGKDLTGEAAMKFQDIVLATIGQAVGAFFFPTRQVGDLASVFFANEGKQYLPEEAGEHNNPLKEVAQPVLENVPGVRQLAITPKHDPFTGGEKSSPFAALRPLTGMTPQIASPLQKELNRTGLAYSKVAPHPMGDRVYDNAVADAYGAIMKESLPYFLDKDSVYHKMPPELQRGLLQTFAGKVRRAAIATARGQFEKGKLPAATKAKYAAWAERQLRESQPAADDEAADAGAAGDVTDTTTDQGAGGPPAATR